MTLMTLCLMTLLHVVLQRIVTFILKSKQQIFREKDGLKPNKNSVSLSQQVKRSKSVS